MAGIIRVVSAGTYKKWLEKQGNPDGPPEVKGARIYKARCISCHSIDGSSGTGPTWKNLWGYEFSHTDGTKHVNDDQHIIESIRYPNKHIRADYPAGGMSAFAENLVSNQQVEYVLAYMKTLSDKAPATTPEETQTPAEPPAATTEPTPSQKK
jgi:cytochrome c oxidase subunit 2